MSQLNWAGNYEYTARELHEPASLDELRRIVARSASIRVLGSRHAFNDIGDAAELVSLRRLPGEVDIDADAMTVTVPAAMTYGALANELVRAGYGLHAMASLPHISVGGAIQTATHGSGDRAGCLATAVRAVEMVTSEGDVVRLSDGDDAFAGAVVGLGALGAVTRVTLAIEPTYDVRQWVYRGLAWPDLLEHVDDIMGAAESVSLFTRWGERIDQVWLKRRVDGGWPDTPEGILHSAVAATGDMHPVEGLSPATATPQMGVAGSWAERLPHFRPDATPSAGAEIQSEYILPREHAVAAIQAVHALGERIEPWLHVSEIRTIASDDLWLSMAQGRESIGFHFTWRREPDAVARLLPEIETALEPFSPRPHWSKAFAMSGHQVVASFPCMEAFHRLRDALDYRGAFRNAYTDRVLYG